MKNKILAIVAVLTAVFTVGCDDSNKDLSKYNRTFFPTNHWEVVGQGTNGQVVVETKSTNLMQNFRVHASSAVAPLTNGQKVRVELTVRNNPRVGGIDLISSKAYPSMD